MVGDGINDAPALAIADVAISLRGGTEVALETADVILLEGGLERLPAVLQLSEDAMARVRGVLGIVLAPNALAIAAGAVGLINPIMAAAVNNGSTIAGALHAVWPLLQRQEPLRLQTPKDEHPRRAARPPDDRLSRALAARYRPARVLPDGDEADLPAGPEVRVPRLPGPVLPLALAHPPPRRGSSPLPRGSVGA
jgi:hypothetical protein